MYINIYIYIYTHTYIYIYIYRQRCLFILFILSKLFTYRKLSLDQSKG